MKRNPKGNMQKRDRDGMGMMGWGYWSVRSSDRKRATLQMTIIGLEVRFCLNSNTVAIYLFRLVLHFPQRYNLPGWC